MIKHNMPDDLSGKMIITNTVTRDDVEAFRTRGVKTLVTTTPEFGGRAFGTNVIQAMLVVLSGKRPEELSSSDYVELLHRVGFKPNVMTLN